MAKRPENAQRADARKARIVRRRGRYGSQTAQLSRVSPFCAAWRSIRYT